MGVGDATSYRWKKVYGGLMPLEFRKLKQLQEENVRLRKLVADLTLDKEMRPKALFDNSCRPNDLVTPAY
jgi:putative transposase